MLKLLFVFFFFSQVETYESLLQDGIQFGYKEKYTEAFTLFNLAISKRPDYPAAYLYKAALLDLYMIDFTDNSKEEEFFSLINKTIKLSENLIKSDNRKEKALGYFFKGSALMYAAVRYGRKKSYINAANAGVSALKILVKVPDYDSTLYDVYLPLGVYSYAVNRLPRGLRFLRVFLPDAGSKEEGIRMMELAMNKGRYVRILAKDALAWVLAYDGQRKKAVKIARELVEEYPGTRAFNWTLAYALKRAGRWHEAELIHKVILYLTLRDQRDYPYNIAFSLYALSICEYVLGKKFYAIFYLDMAKAFLQDARDIPEKKDLEKRINRLNKRLERYRKLYNEKKRQELVKELHNYGE